AFGLYKGHYTYPMVAQFSTGILAQFSISIYSFKRSNGYKILSFQTYKAVCLIPQVYRVSLFKDYVRLAPKRTA
ncbi:hypothetical protein, partial [Phocaeicola vulgatus]|uniref:hypothetical protein n=1 Tax=Phocaeicola vulgatus TaxID=821 RepID=UPI001F2432E8